MNPRDIETTQRPCADTGEPPEAVSRAIRAHGERIKQQELQQAMSRLEADGRLTPTQRRIVDEMATAILDEILSSPESVLEADEHDPEAVRTAVDLFDPRS